MTEDSNKDSIDGGITDLFSMQKPQKKKLRDLEKALKLLGVESPNICYQCSKCTSGCEAMKLLELEPHSIMASAKSGFIEEIMQLDLVWTCIGCYKCKERCPQKMSPVEVLFIIKNWLVAEGKKLPGNYPKIIQGVLTNGFVQEPLEVRDRDNRGRTRESLKLPELKKPNMEKLTKIISELAIERLEGVEP